VHGTNEDSEEQKGLIFLLSVKKIKIKKVAITVFVSSVILVQDKHEFH